MCRTKEGLIGQIFNACEEAKCSKPQVLIMQHLAYGPKAVYSCSILHGENVPLYSNQLVSQIRHNQDTSINNQLDFLSLYSSSFTFHFCQADNLMQFKSICKNSVTTSFIKNGILTSASCGQMTPKVWSTHNHFPEALISQDEGEVWNTEQVLKLIEN